MVRNQGEHKQKRDYTNTWRRQRFTFSPRELVEIPAHYETLYRWDAQTQTVIQRKVLRPKTVAFV